MAFFRCNSGSGGGSELPSQILTTQTINQSITGTNISKTAFSYTLLQDATVVTGNVTTSATNPEDGYIKIQVNDVDVPNSKITLRKSVQTPFFASGNWHTGDVIKCVIGAPTSHTGATFTGQGWVLG